MNYRDDALKLTFRFADDEQNLGLVNGVTDVTMALETTDMTGMSTDANPATVADWDNGAWQRYETKTVPNRFRRLSIPLFLSR